MIAIFDLGRTHKKFILFDQDYRVVAETTADIPDIKDEDGDLCEDLPSISKWMQALLQEALENKAYDIQAVNFSAHGASMVHLNRNGQAVTPLYDYMKPLAPPVHDAFYGLFNGEEAFSLATGSPALDMLNCGIQLFWLRETKPGLFRQIEVSLHLPQYANFLFSKKPHADITSIGCHTGLWDFNRKTYHQWLQQQEVLPLLPQAEGPEGHDIVHFGEKAVAVGIGLHDSSAALLPFVYTATAPFVLLSSGTWNITLNPFFDGALGEADYKKDCLYYLLDMDRKVAASRLFLGNEYQHQVRKLETWFGKPSGYYLQVMPDAGLFARVLEDQSEQKVFYPETMGGTGPFPKLAAKGPDLGLFHTFEEAYHKLMLDLTYLQTISLGLVSRRIKRLYISGGFVQSRIFMELLQCFLPDWDIFIAENKRASALGAAVVMHDAWQAKPLSPAVSPIIPFQGQLNLNLDAYKNYFSPQ